MRAQTLPEPLRAAVRKDDQPVTPLPPVWQRTVLVAVVTATVFAVAVAVFKLRTDLDALPVWLSWGCSFLELGIGVILIGLALRESVPGSGSTSGTVAVSMVAALAVQMLVGIATWMQSTGIPYGPETMHQNVACLKNDLVMALPTLGVTLWLIFRSLPLRAPIAGALGGTGTGIAIDAVAHLRCGMSDLRHVLVWHTGGILVLAAFGVVVGSAWARWRWRRSARP